MSNRPVLLSQVFPINESQLPDLQAFRVKTKDDSHSIGGGLSYEAYKHGNLSGTWVWSRSNRRLITDANEVSDEDLDSLVKACWEKDGDRYRNLLSILPDPNSEVNAQAQADFVAQGLWHKYKRAVQRQVSDLNRSVDPVRIERRCRCNPLVVGEKPALQLEVSSQVTHQNTLREYLDRHPDTDLVGLAVADRTGGNLKGTITAIAGKLVEHRARLLRFDLSEEMIGIIKAADEEAKVVSVEPFGAGDDHYDYVVDALDIVVQTEHYKRLNIPTKVQNQLTFSPSERVEAIQSAVAPLKSEGLVGKAISSKSHPEVFGDAGTIGYKSERRLADGSISRGEEAPLKSLNGKGLVENPPVLKGEENLRVAVLSCGVSLQKSNFGAGLQERIESLNLPSMEVLTHGSAPETQAVRAAVEELSEANPHVLIALLPDSGSTDDRLYPALKQAASEAKLPSQVIQESTLNESFALDNIALGIVSKMGGIPYLLGDPLSYADRVVGLDIARTNKERSAGTMSIAASTHHFGSDGRLQHYATQEVGVEGETLPPDALRSLFPREEYSGTETLVHRDGPFRGGEAETLLALGEEIDASFQLVEILKKGAPRLYEVERDGKVKQISKGAYLRAGDNVAYVASTPPPFGGSTSQPLQVRVDRGDISIENAVHSVLAFTLMHYGSVRPPRLPVTIHYSDKIAKLLLDGIRPHKPQGRKPYWL